jgi:sec-independent protein translocase protein TatA
MNGVFIPLFPGVPGGPELIVILLIAILLFGANKIPKLARSSGEAIGEFQKGRQQVEEELEQMKESELDAETETATETASEAGSTGGDAGGGGGGGE